MKMMIKSHTGFMEIDLREHATARARRRTLIAQRAAVLARVGSAGKRAALPVDPDRLAAAVRPAAHHPMAHGAEFDRHVLGDAALKGEDTRVVKSPW